MLKLLLEISDMSPKDAFFVFMDDLQLWVKFQLQNQYLKDLVTPTAATEQLYEILRIDNGRDKGKRLDQGTSRRDRHSSPAKSHERAKTPSTIDENKWIQGKKGKIEDFKCYICQESSHFARDFLNRNVLHAIIQVSRAT